MNSAGLPAYPRLEGETEADVAIIGGGITGITAALILQRAGKRVALLEARRIGGGETGHTTAHLTEMVDTEYRVIARNFGADGARFVASISRASMDFIAQRVSEMNAPGFRVVPGYRYTDRVDDVGLLEEECEAARAAGVRASLTREVPLPFHAEAAILVEDQAEFHPLAYLGTLAVSAEREGSAIYEQTRALRIKDGSPCRVETDTGAVTCESVIEATNVPLNRVFLQTKIAHYRTYALAFELRAPVPPGLYWDMCEPYHYVRLAAEDSLLIVGGEDHKTGTERETSSHFTELIRFASERYPVTGVSHGWSGQVIEPVDGLPFIGKNALSSHVFVATGFSGNGMTFGTVAAMLLSQEILGKTDPLSQIFSPTRVKPMSSAKNFVAENVDYPLHMVRDRLRRSEAKSVHDVGPGEGKIVRAEGRRYAVYREPEGALKVLSPVCTHLGCLVQFNEAERTWDCPCHGSRFDVEGGVINGPAVRALSKKEIPERKKKPVAQASGAPSRR